MMTIEVRKASRKKAKARIGLAGAANSGKTMSALLIAYGLVSDWRSIGGVKMPYLSETHAGPVTIVNTIDQVIFDEPVDDKMFEPPTPGAP